MIPASSTAPLPLDLSGATKLEGLEFECSDPDVPWVITTLETVEAKSLREITIHALIHPRDPTETVLRGWRDLDCLLVKLWTSRSVRPRIIPATYTEEGWTCPSELAARLLPELASRGAIDAVEGKSQITIRSSP